MDNFRLNEDYVMEIPKNISKIQWLNNKYFRFEIELAKVKFPKQRSNYDHCYFCINWHREFLNIL